MCFFVRSVGRAVAAARSRCIRRCAPFFPHRREIASRGEERPVPVGIPPVGEKRGSKKKRKENMLDGTRRQTGTPQDRDRHRVLRRCAQYGHGHFIGRDRLLSDPLLRAPVAAQFLLFFCDQHARGHGAHIISIVDSFCGSARCLPVRAKGASNGHASLLARAQPPPPPTNVEKNKEREKKE